MIKSEKIKIPDNLNYVIIEDLPEDQQKPFDEWLLGQTTPVIPEEELFRHKPVFCGYAHDYHLWYDYWIKGEEAPKWQPDNDEINITNMNEELLNTGIKEPLPEFRP